MTKVSVDLPKDLTQQIKELAIPLSVVCEHALRYEVLTMELWLHTKQGISAATEGPRR